MDDFQQIREDLTAIGDALAAHQADNARLRAALRRLSAVAVWDEDTDRAEFDSAQRDAEDALSAPAMQPTQVTA